MSIEGTPSAAAPRPSPPGVVETPRVVEPGRDPPRARLGWSRPPRVVEPVETPEPARWSSLSRPRPSRRPSPSRPRREPAEAPSGTSSGLGLVDVRRLWPDLLEAVKLKRRFTWILLSQNAQVAARRRQDPDDRPAQRRGPQLVQQRRQRGDPAPGGDRRDRPRLAYRGDRRPVRPARLRGAAHRHASRRSPRPGPPSPSPSPAAGPRRPVDPESIATARGDHRGHPRSRCRRAAAARGRGSDAGADRDDPDADDHSLGGAQLLERELGASIIEEIKHD